MIQYQKEGLPERLPIRLAGSTTRAILDAGEFASSRNHPYIDTAHLAMALLVDPDVQQELLMRGINTEKVRAILEELTLRHEDTPYYPPRLTERAKLAITLAGIEAQTDGAIELTSLHLLRGIVREGEGIGASVLESEGLSYRDFS